MSQTINSNPAGPIAPISEPAAPRLWIPAWMLLLAALAWVGFRLYINAMQSLVPDEAYYWVWSRHLAIGYLDHPPMVAWMILLGTALLGQCEAGVRLFATISMLATIVVLAWITWKMLRGHPAALFVPSVLLLCPIVNISASIITPDTSAIFFQSAAMASAIAVFLWPNFRGGLWILVGLFAGLALLSKYTSILFVASLFLALVSNSAGRRQLVTPWAWIGAVIALAVFSPTIIWNYQNHWASFAFQLHHGMNAGDSPAWRNIAEFLGAQLAICTPILFLLVLVVIWSSRRMESMPVRILFFCTISPLVFFTLTAFRHKVEGNWPMFAYLPATMLVANWLAKNWRPKPVYWANVAMQVALGATVLVHSPKLVWWINPRWSTNQWDSLFGWRELAEKVDSVGHGLPVFTSDYEYASELSFYLPGRPEIRPLANPGRRTAFDFFGASPDPGSYSAIIHVRSAKDQAKVAPQSWMPSGFKEFEQSNFDSVIEGRTVRRSLLTIARK